MRKIKQVFPSKHCSTWIQKENIATELFFFTSVRVPGRSRSFGPLTFWKNAKKNTWQKQAWKNHFVGGNNSEKRYFSKHKSKKNQKYVMKLWSYERWRIFMNQRQLSHECCLKKSYITYIWLIWPFNSKGNHKKNMLPVTDLDFLWFETGCFFLKSTNELELN